MGNSVGMILSLIAVLMTAGAVESSQAETPSDVAAVVQRTRTNRGTYSVYYWYRMSSEGEPVVEE